MHSKKSPVNVEDIVVSIDQRDDRGHIISVWSPSCGRSPVNAKRHYQEENNNKLGNLDDQRRDGEFFNRVDITGYYVLFDIFLHLQIQWKAP